MNLRFYNQDNKEIVTINFSFGCISCNHEKWHIDEYYGTPEHVYRDTTGTKDTSDTKNT